MERLPLSLHNALYGSAAQNIGAIEMSVAARLRIAHGLASGLRFVHSQTPVILHRDLKPSNVLLSADLLTVKLCDFGLAREESNQGHTVGVGTLSYIAPEVMTTVHYDAKADVYSFAVVLWELFSATPPFGNLAAAQVTIAVCVRGERPSPDPPTMPASLCQEMKRAWVAAPAERPTMAALVSALGAEMKKAVDPDDKHEDDSCVVCLDERRVIAFVPCGHISCCSWCSQQVHACPVCRGVIESTLKVFL